MTRKKPSTRCRLFPIERERIAYMIGAGGSAPEISEEIEGATADSIYYHARRMGLRFVDKHPTQSAVVIVLDSKALNEASKLAFGREISPERMIGRIIETLMVDRALFREVMDRGQK